MVSSLDLSCNTVHDGVTRRSVWKVGSASAADVDGVVMMTEISAGVWKAILTCWFRG